jgi:crossover junction endodeoxyribonuclease RuvC
MIILGIDPGTERIGYGLIKKSPPNKLEFLEAGLLGKIGKDNKKAPQSGEKEKYMHLARARSALRALIEKFKPEVLAIEKLYFVNNQKTGIAVAEARGVLLLEALDMGLKLEEYGPNEIKAGVTGYGLADKKAVCKMVKLTLKTPELDVIDDASDALAAAIMAAGNRY